MLANHMGWAAVAARTHADPAAIGLGIADELRNGGDRNRRVHLHDVRHTHDTCHGSDVTNEIVIELCKQRGVDRGRGADHKEGVAVRGCAHHSLDADIAAATRTVLYEELLAEMLRQPLTHQARSNVVYRSGGEG